MRMVAFTRSASAESWNQVCAAASALGVSRDSWNSLLRECGDRGVEFGLHVICCSRRVGLFAGLDSSSPRRVHQVVGGQAQPGVAQVGLHGLRAAGDLGLPAERLELAAQFGGEVGEPGEVGLHRVELADRLLLALAVLEHARGLLDERAAVLRARFQDRRQPALTDDDVHLPADTGVAEQFLHVHQPARAAVDLVFARAVAEHAPGDRHLGVVDGQRAVGVVDGQRHLGAAERRPARRCRRR